MKVTISDSFRIDMDYGEGFVDVNPNNEWGSVELQTYEWNTYFVIAEDPDLMARGTYGRKIIFFPNKEWFKDWHKENQKVKIVFSTGKCGK